jgi:Domain of unknown function (DUF3597)
MEECMGILGNLMSAIFGSSARADAPASPAAPSSPASAPSPAAAGAPAGQTVDVAAILDDAVAKKKEKLAWRTSIVDLMKALDLDSSLAARKQLAQELHYSGDMNDSAKMNVWLQVMQKLAENGGKVPEELKS